MKSDWLELKIHLNITWSRSSTTYLECTQFIGAHLRTGARNIAFINVLTRPIIHQLIAFTAFTVERGWGIDTGMLTTTVTRIALILITFIFGFILEFRTISFRITNFTQWNTHAATTIEFCFNITFTCG